MAISRSELAEVVDREIRKHQPDAPSMGKYNLRPVSRGEFGGVAYSRLMLEGQDVWRSYLGRSEGHDALYLETRYRLKTAGEPDPELELVSAKLGYRDAHDRDIQFASLEIGQDGVVREVSLGRDFGNDLGSIGNVVFEPNTLGAIQRLEGQGYEAAIPEFISAVYESRYVSPVPQMPLGIQEAA